MSKPSRPEQAWTAICPRIRDLSMLSLLILYFTFLFPSLLSSPLPRGSSASLTPVIAGDSVKIKLHSHAIGDQRALCLALAVTPLRAWLG